MNAGDDLTLLMILEARDLASAVIRGVQGNLSSLSGTQKLIVGGMIAGGIASMDAAKKVFDFTSSGIKQAISYQAQMTQLHTQAHASLAEVKTMYDYLLTQGPKLGVAPQDMVRGLYNIESVAARVHGRFKDLGGGTKDLVNAMAKLQVLATAGNPSQLDSRDVAQSLISPLITQIATQHQQGRSDQHFQNAQQVAAFINRVVGYGDMRMPDFIRAISTGFLANLAAEHFDMRSSMAAFATMTDAAIPPSRAAIYLRQIGAMITSAATKPKTEGMLQAIGLTGQQLQRDAASPGSMLTVFEDLKKHLAETGNLASTTAADIARSFGAAMPKTKSEAVTMLDAIEQKLGQLKGISSQGKQALADMLGTSNRSESLINGIERLKTALGKGGSQIFGDELLTVLFGGSRTGAGGGLLLQAINRFRERYKDVGNPLDPKNQQAFQQGYKEQLDTPQGKINQFHASVQALKIALGTGFLPVLTELFTKLNLVLEPLIKWTTKHKELAAIIAGSLFVFFSLVAVLLLGSAAFLLLTAAGSAFEIALAPLLITLGLIPLAIAGIIVAGYFLITRWSEVKTFFGNLGDFLMQLFEGVWHFIEDSAISFWEFLKAVFWDGVYNLLLPIKALIDGAAKLLGWAGIHINTSGFDGFIDHIKQRSNEAATASQQAAEKALGAWDGLHFGDHHKTAGAIARRNFAAGFGEDAPLKPIAFRSPDSKVPGPPPPPESDHHLLMRRLNSNNPLDWWRAVMGSSGSGKGSLIYDGLSAATQGLYDGGKIALDGLKNEATKSLGQIKSIWTDPKTGLGGMFSSGLSSVANFGASLFTGSRKETMGPNGPEYVNEPGKVQQAMALVGHTFESGWNHVKRVTQQGWGDTQQWLELQFNRLTEDGERIFRDFYGWMGRLWADIYNQAANSWSNVTSLLGNAGAQILKGLIAGLTQHLGQLKSWFDGLPGRILQWLGKAGSWLLGKGGDVITGLWNGMKTGWNTVSGWLSTLGGLVTGAVVGAATWLFKHGSEALTGLKNGAIAGWKDVKSWFTDLKNLVTTTVGNAARWLWQHGSEALTGLKNGAIAAWNTVRSWFSNLGHLVGTTVGSALRWIYKQGTDMLDGLKNGAVVGWDKVKSWFTGVGGLVSKTVASGIKWLETHGGEALTGLHNGAKSGWNMVKGWFSSVGSTVTSTVGKVGAGLNWLKGHGQDALTGLWNGAKSIWNGDVSKWFGGLKGLITGFFTDAGKWLVDAGSSIINGLWNGMKSAWSSVSSWLSGLGGVISSIKGPLEKDKVLLQPAGQAIMQGLLAGMQQQWPNAQAFLRNVTSSIAATNHSAVASTPIPATSPAPTGGGTTIIDLRNSYFLDQNAKNRLLDELGGLLTKTTLPGSGMQVQRG